MRRSLGVAFVALLFIAPPAQATPVQWSLTGVVTSAIPPLSNSYPVGTPLSLLLFFDTFAPNLALNPATQGLFVFQNTASQVTIGGQTFAAPLLGFEINCPGASCGGGPGVLQLFDPLDAFTRVVLNTGIPNSVSIEVGASAGFLTVLCVVCPPSGTWAVTSSVITTTPEPVSIVMIGTGLLALAKRQRTSLLNLKKPGR